MKLKLRYVFFLGLILLLIIAACYLSIHLINDGKYGLALVLFLILFSVTFLLGRKFAHIFLTLSFLKMIRNSGGSMSLTDFDSFMYTTLGKRRNAVDVAQIQQSILEKLVQEDVVRISNNTIYLVG